MICNKTIGERELKSMGFEYRVSRWRNILEWQWGGHTVNTDIGHTFYEPIITYNIETRMARVDLYDGITKKIYTTEGMSKLMDLASFLMSVEI